MNNPEVLYNQLRDQFIQARTKQEQIILNLAQYIRKAPKELLAELPPIDHEITLKGFIPALYEDEVNRKAYAQQLYKCNAFIDAWNKLVDKNDAEAAAILEEMRQRGVA